MEKNTQTDPPETNTGARRYSKTERNRILKDFQNSELSLYAFCRKTGHRYTTVRHWIHGKPKAPAKKKTPTFLQVSAHQPLLSPNAPMVIELKSGHRIHIHHCDHSRWALRLMELLEAGSC